MINKLEEWWSLPKNQNILTNSVKELESRMEKDPLKISDTISIDHLDLPNTINTLRIFALRPDSKYPLERHLNSDQWIKTLVGSGHIEVHSDSNQVIFHQLNERQTGSDAWSYVAAKIWHRPANTAGDLWITAAFHTAAKVIDEFE